MLFHLSFLDKRKVGGDSCYPQKLQSNAKQPSELSHRIIELATLLGEILKSGVNLGLGHLYLLSLFDLFALHFWVFAWALVKDPILGSGSLLGKQQ